MASLDVLISKKKCLISKTGCLELAKRRNGTLITESLSPVSMRIIVALVNSIFHILCLNGSVSL